MVIIVTLTMSYIYYTVRRQMHASKKWRFSFRNRKLDVKQQPSTTTCAEMSSDSSGFGQPSRKDAATSATSRQGWADNSTSSFGPSANAAPTWQSRFGPPSRKDSGASALSSISFGNKNNKKKAKKSKAQLLEREVFWQSIFYVTAFYIVWPLLAVMYADPHEKGFSLWVILTIVAPSQGVLNAMTYFRYEIATLHASISPNIFKRTNCFPAI